MDLLAGLLNASDRPERHRRLSGGGAGAVVSTHGGLYAWEFEKGGRALRVGVAGQLTFNESGPMVDAALAGFGLAYLPEDAVERHILMQALTHRG